MRMKTCRPWLAVLLAVALVLSLAACGGAGDASADPAPETPAPSQAPASQAPADPAKGVTVCVAGEPQTLDPTRNGSVDVNSILVHLFEGLMRWEDSGESAGPGLGRARIACGQAERYERTANADGTARYTFHLRADAKWSDGKAVTAQDFVYAWQRLVAPPTGAEYDYLLECVVNADAIMRGEKEPAELAVRAVDDKTLEVTVRDVPYFLELCALPATFPVRQDVVEKDPESWPQSPETCISNGMYKLGSWTRNSEVVLVKNEGYYEPARAEAESITFWVNTGEAGVLSAYQDGRLDFARFAPADKLAELLADGTAAAADYMGTYFLSFQTERAPFDDARVRQAFTLAVDREKLVEGTGHKPAGGLVPAGVDDVEGKDFRAAGGDYYPLDDYKANCKRAKELLAEAGYPGGAGMPTVEYLYNAGPVHKAVAEALREMWQSVLGVRVSLKEEEWGSFLRLRKDGEFSIARDTWTADYNDPVSFLDLWCTGGRNNNARYAAADFDQCISDAKTSADPARRMELLHRAEDAIVGRDFALCPLYFYSRTYLAKEDVKGVCYAPEGLFLFHGCSR